MEILSFNLFFLRRREPCRLCQGGRTTSYPGLCMLNFIAKISQEASKPSKGPEKYILLSKIYFLLNVSGGKKKKKKTPFKMRNVLSGNKHHFDRNHFDRTCDISTSLLRYYLFQEKVKLFRSFLYEEPLVVKCLPMWTSCYKFLRDQTC